jgi:hypothetical protein
MALLVERDLDANLGIVVTAWNDQGRVLLYERSSFPLPPAFE